MDNIIRAWAKPSIVNCAIFAYSASPTLKYNWVCLDDVAACMAAGKPVRFQSLSPDEFAARMTKLVNDSREVEPHSIYDGMPQFYRYYNEQPVSPLVVGPK